MLNVRTKRFLILICLALNVFLILSGCATNISTEEDTEELEVASLDPTINQQEAPDLEQETAAENNQITSDNSTPSVAETQTTKEGKVDSLEENEADSKEEGLVEESSDLYAVWVQARSVKTPEKADEMLNLIEKGKFNAIFLNIFERGYAHYKSDLLQKEPNLATDYDPLAYVIEQAHRRGIQVHAWFVTGNVGDGQRELGPILTQNPEWAMVRPDGSPFPWLNFTRPDVRDFLSDVVLEVVREYDVDGIHFDYLRYPGTEVGYDTYSAEQLALEKGIDLNTLRYAELPAYGRFFRGNPLGEIAGGLIDGVETAQVLVEFDNGRPAVLINNYGQGQTILFNWDAKHRQIAASSEILTRGIEHLLDPEGEVYLLNSEANAEEYGLGGFRTIAIWLKDLGWQPIELAEDDVVALDTNSVVVLPNVYIITPQLAEDLANFLNQGGGLIFIDGPTPSIADNNLQNILGVWGKAGHFFGEAAILRSTGEHPLIPTSNRQLTLEQYQALDEQWIEFRKQGINKFLDDVYHQVKNERADVTVTITVNGNQEHLAQRDFLDWQAWLDGDYIDLLIPRAYVDINEFLEPVLEDWQPAIQNYPNKVMMGLINHSERKREPKTARRILEEVELTLDNGSNGVIIFDINRVDPETLEPLAQEIPLLMKN